MASREEYLQNSEGSLRAAEKEYADIQKAIRTKQDQMRKTAEELEARIADIKSAVVNLRNAPDDDWNAQKTRLEQTLKEYETVANQNKVTS